MRQRTGIFSPEGQISFIRYLFSTTSTSTAVRSREHLNERLQHMRASSEKKQSGRERRDENRFDPEKDLGHEKVWMRSHIRPKLEAKVIEALYSGFPSQTRKFVHANNPEGFVEYIARQKYGSVSKENSRKAQEDAISIMDLIEKRYSKLIIASQQVNVKHQNPNTSRKIKENTITRNARDGFAHAIQIEGTVQLFGMDLKKLKI